MGAIALIVYQSRRLAGVFGRPLEQVTAAEVEAMVATGSREEEDLDFKEKSYADKTERSKQELAKDIAAFANAQGGVILIGIVESQGVAIEAKPVDCSDAVIRGLGQAIAGLIYPMPLFGVDSLPLSGRPAEGYILITIPRSKDAPHAVRIDNKALLYPRRLGTQTHFLSENEVASAYRDRFATARQQVDELSQVWDEGCRMLISDKGWLCLALTPNSAADIRWSPASTQGYQEWACDIQSILPKRLLFEAGTCRVVPRARRLTLVSKSHSWSELATGNYAELYNNGSGFAASPVFDIHEQREMGGSFGLAARLPIQDEDVVTKLSGVLTLLVEHAVAHGGLVGDAIVRLSVLSRERDLPHMSIRPARARVRLNGSNPNVVKNTRLLDSFPVSEKTISLTETSQSSREHLIAVRLLLTDFFQAFGLIEVPQIDERGELRKLYWSPEHHPALEGWAHKNNIRVYDDVPE